MIVSGSYGGRIARWKSTKGREIRSCIAVGGGKARSVFVSRDGKRAAFAVDGKVCALGADAGDVLLECGMDSRALCAVFGSDYEIVPFGRLDCTTGALTPDGGVICEMKAQRAHVLDLPQIEKSPLLPSVSHAIALCRSRSLERTK